MEFFLGLLVELPSIWIAPIRAGSPTTVTAEGSSGEKIPQTDAIPIISVVIQFVTPFDLCH